MEEDILEKRYEEAMKVLNETSLPLFVEDTFEDIFLAYKQDEKVIKEAREFIENKMEYLKKCRTFKVVFYDEENMKHEWNEHLLYKENELLKILKEIRKRCE